MRDCLPQLHVGDGGDEGGVLGGDGAGGHHAAAGGHHGDGGGGHAGGRIQVDMMILLYSCN